MRTGVCRYMGTGVWRHAYGYRYKIQEIQDTRCIFRHQKTP